MGTLTDVEDRDRFLEELIGEIDPELNYCVFSEPGLVVGVKSRRFSFSVSCYFELTWAPSAPFVVYLTYSYENAMDKVKKIDLERGFGPYVGGVSTGFAKHTQLPFAIIILLW